MMIARRRAETGRSQALALAALLAVLLVAAVMFSHGAAASGSGYVEERTVRVELSDDMITVDGEHHRICEPERVKPEGIAVMRVLELPEEEEGRRGERSTT